MIQVNKPLCWLRMLHCIILLHRYEYNTIGSKKMCLMFLPCEVGPYSSALRVLIIYVIQLRINPLINLPGRLLTVNVWDVICIWGRYGEIINPLRRWGRTIHRSISLTYWNSWRCRSAVVFILGAVCELVGREEKERSLMISSLCSMWAGTTTSVISIVTIITRSSWAAIIRFLVGWAIFIVCSCIKSDWHSLQSCDLPFRPYSTCFSFFLMTVTNVLSCPLWNRLWSSTTLKISRVSCSNHHHTRIPHLVQIGRWT
jgi:hypothetical protein